MFDTVAQISFAVALILPGFLVVQLSERRRPATPAGGDLELVLRGLVYALVIQAVATLTGWLPGLVRDLDGGDWDEHASALALYALVVCVGVPTLIGLGLGTVLRDAESSGGLRWWHYALGGRDARRAWDFLFSCHNGSWMRIHLKDAPAGGPAMVVGKYGKSSWAAQAPAAPDLYLQEAWATAEGLSRDDIDRGGLAMWIDGERIARIEAGPKAGDEAAG